MSSNMKQVHTVYTPLNTVYNSWERTEQLTGSFGSIFIFLSTKSAKGPAHSPQPLVTAQT